MFSSGGSLLGSGGMQETFGGVSMSNGQCRIPSGNSRKCYVVWRLGFMFGAGLVGEVYV